MEAFADDREKYGTDPAPQLPGQATASALWETMEEGAQEVSPRVRELAGQDPLPVAREIGRMKNDEAMLRAAIIRAQGDLLSIVKPEWNVTKAIEAAEWADRSRGTLRDLAQKIDETLQAPSLPYAALREALRNVVDEINLLGP